MCKYCTQLFDALFCRDPARQPDALCVLSCISLLVFLCLFETSAMCSYSLSFCTACAADRSKDDVHTLMHPVSLSFFLRIRCGLTSRMIVIQNRLLCVSVFL